jgi:glycosyltransferase involved in cell wall biosynthesis
MTDYESGEVGLLNRIGKTIRYRFGGRKPTIHQQTVTLHPQVKSRGNVLLSYIINPFLLGKSEAISNDHTHHWESFQIAQTFLKHGFRVDVISYLNTAFVPSTEYAYFISARTNLEKVARKLNGNCIVVAHLDTAHWISSNHSAYTRLLALKERRQRSIMNSLKLIESNAAFEFARLGTVLGNDYTIDTYRYANKPIYRIPISTTAVYEWNPHKDFERCRNNYLWFGSSGFVHKGLDLVLEAFARMPEHHLTVCGPFDEEKDFLDAYHRELFQTPNIHAAGWTDVNSSKFTEIANNCAGLVYPSCAEGGGGSAITCMHAGIIPILSREASVDIDEDCGRLLPRSSVEEIIDAVRMVSALPASRLQQLARNAWQRARESHTRERFAAEYDRFVAEILLPRAFGE